MLNKQFCNSTNLNDNRESNVFRIESTTYKRLHIENLKGNKNNNGD